MPTTQRDRFDTVPDLARVGSHRAPRGRGRGWIVFAWAALATGVLVGAGALGLAAIQSRVGQDGASGTSASAAPSAAATIDPKIDVELRNGTTTAGLAAAARKQAEKAGWTVGSVKNADSTNVATTTVYYTSSGQAGAAEGLAKTLGASRTALSKQFAASGGSGLTVVLGKDYAAKTG